MGIWFVLICYLLITVIQALDSSYVYEITPEGSDFDMRCVIENIEFARAVRYQAQPSTCEKLPETWNENRTTESGFVYIWMKWFDVQFEETYITTVTIPENFDVGFYVDVVVETTDVILDGFTINFRNSLGTIQYLHLRIRPTWGKAILNTKFGEMFGSEVHVPIEGFANTTNTIYTTSIFFQATHWEIYTDDIFLSNFTDVYGFNGTGRVKFHSEDVLCKRMIFYVP